jgi:tRNA (guanine37-N1)-methyltransferase
MVLIDTVSRQISGVLGNQDSLNDSFADDLLDYPHYTRPEAIDGQQFFVYLFPLW